MGCSRRPRRDGGVTGGQSVVRVTTEAPFTGGALWSFFATQLLCARRWLPVNSHCPLNQTPHERRFGFTFAISPTAYGGVKHDFPERYRSGHNGGASKASCLPKAARGFESHPLRQTIPLPFS